MDKLRSFSFHAALLVLIVTFCTIQFQVVHTLNDSLHEEASTSSILSIPIEHHKMHPEILDNLNIKPRASSDDEDKSGFIHSIWAIFLFSLLGILACVGFMVLLLRVVCSEKQRKHEDKANPVTEQIIPPRSTFRHTPIQKEVLPAHNPTFEEETQIDEIYAQPNKNYGFRAENFPSQSVEKVMVIPPPQPYPLHNEYPNTEYPRNIDVEPVTSSLYYPITVNPNDMGSSIPYSATEYNQDVPFKYLDKYNPSQGTGVEQPSAPPRAVLRDNTPYKVVTQKAHLSGENKLNEPELEQHHVRFDSPSPPPMHSHLPSQQPIMYEGANRFVRVLPREPPVTGVLKPSPVFRRKF
ncbi:unnamed protein product [Orchesella dallaii]|uniref:Uncharacterized protein n=1 Tax=Orchesella dallaii TaxID=48710 RepID=A0ABP1QS45_9HEXA